MSNDEGTADIIAAVLAEREACAKVAEDDTSFMMLQDFGMQSTCTQVRANIADAIRSRPSPPSTAAPISAERDATIESLVKALEIAEGVLSNVPYDFATTNGGRIPVTKASEARDIARAEITKLRGGEHEGR